MKKFKCIQASMFDGRVIRNGETIETDVDLSGHVGFAEIKPVPVTPSAPENPPPAPPASPDAPPPAPPAPPSAPEGNNGRKGGRKASQK